jgi:hypothetical protein
VVLTVELLKVVDSNVWGVRGCAGASTQAHSWVSAVRCC